VLSAFMLTIYGALLLLSLYIAWRYWKAETQHVRKIVRKTRSTISRLYLMYKLTLILMKKPFTAVVVLIIVVSILISAFSAGSSVGVSLIRGTFEDSGKPGDILIELDNPSTIDCSALVKVIENLTSTPLHNESCLFFMRITLESPAKLNISKEPIYVIIGSPSKYNRELFGKGLLNEVGYIHASSLGEYVTLYLPDGTVRTFYATAINETLLQNAKILDSLPLLPIQGYIGSKPIVTPPKYVLITSRTYLSTILDVGMNVATDIQITDLNFEPEKGDVAFLYTTLKRILPVRAVWVMTSEGVLVASKSQIPTKESVITALVASLLATIMAASLFTTVIPYIRKMSEKLSYEGFPPWASRMIMFFYSTTLTWAPSAVVLPTITIVLGSVAAFNSLITSVLVWVTLTAYVYRAVRPSSLMTDIYTPPTTRYEIMIKGLSLQELTELVRRLITTNEFFTVEELESRVGKGEALIHARLNYVESWGSGLDINISAAESEGITSVSISINFWGIEEFSESITRNMIALALSRIAGGIRSWESVQLK